MVPSAIAKRIISRTENTAPATARSAQAPSVSFATPDRR